MRKVTTDFKNQIERDNRNYYEWVDITLKDGTVLNLTNENIWNSGIKIEDAVSDTSEFQIGTAIINKATVTLNNLYDDFTDYDFDEAKIVIYIGYNIDSTILYRVLQDTTGKNILDSTGNEIVTLVNGSIVEKVKMFTGTVVNSPYQNSSLITLTCEDNMLLFDRDYSESKLIYPATRAQILRDACEMCGVSLETLTFDNSDYIVKTRPSDEKLTFRQVIAWTAQLGGQFLRCNSDGKLFCGWYDLKNYEADTVNEEYFDVIASNSSVTVNSEDVIITGIQVTAYQENQSEEEAADTSLYGKTGYVIAIADNKLIEKGTASTVAAMIGERVTGMRFRPFSASTLNNPTYEAGDICIIKDRKGVSYKSFLTSSTFQVGKYHTVQCGAKSAAKNSSKQYSVFSQAQVENRKNFQREKTEREKAVEEFNKALDSASGMFPTEVKQEDGSTILYVHDKKTLKDSKNVFKITSDAVGFSTDGGKTYPFGFTINGDFLTRILYAIGINADYINVGALTVRDKDGNIIFQADMTNKRVIISGDYVQIGGKTVPEKLNEVNAQIEIINGKIKSVVTKDDVTSIIEQSADSIRLQAKKLTWEAENSSLKEDGSFSCKNANISGNLTSSLDTEKYDFSSEISETVYLKRGVKTTGYGLNIKGKNKTSTSEKYGGLALIPCSDYYRFSQQNEENYTSCISANDKLIIQAQEVSDDTKAKYVSIEFDTAETPGLQMITSASQMVLFDIDQSGARFNSDRTMVNNLKLTTYKTVTESPNLYIDGTYYDGNYSGYVCKSSSSSRRYKTNITKVDEELNTDALYNLPVKSYTYKENYLSETDRNCGKRMIGFIAEDVDKIYPKACQYDEDGKPEMWNSKILIPAMLDLIQKQHVEIEKIKEKLNEK